MKLLCTGQLLQAARYFTHWMVMHTTGIYFSS